MRRRLGAHSPRLAAHFQSGMGIGQRSSIAERTAHKVGSALSYPAGDDYGPIALVDVHNRARGDAAKVTEREPTNGDRHVESTGVAPSSRPVKRRTSLLLPIFACFPWVELHVC